MKNIIFKIDNEQRIITSVPEESCRARGTEGTTPTTERRCMQMQITTQENKTFATYAAQTYATRKEAIDFLENSLDPWEKAIGTLIKKYAGCEQNV